jgi:hypothetical protein
MELEAVVNWRKMEKRKSRFKKGCSSFENKILIQGTNFEE